LFAELIRFCPRCGWAPAGERCPLCATPTDVASTTPTRFIGRWADVRRRMGHRRGVVVQRSTDVVTILNEDGRTTEAKAGRARLVDAVGTGPAVRSGAGELLAAARGGDVSEALRTGLVTYAVATADRGGPRLQRALVIDGFILGDPVGVRARHLRWTAVLGHQRLKAVALAPHPSLTAK
jgi:hypothetical protein